MFKRDQLHPSDRWFYIALVCTIVLFLVAGCDEDKKPAEALPPYTNTWGQSVETVEYEDGWKAWLDSHKDAKIISIAPISYKTGTVNSTSHLIIVYEERVK